MTLHLERLSCERLAEVIAIETAGQPHPWSPAQFAEAFGDDRASLWGACESCGACGVCEKPSLLGYALLYRLPFEAELQAITVAPYVRRRGVAKALLERLCDEARAWQSERLLLEVRESNRAARALYERAGFTLDGRRRGYYRSATGGGEDALLMSKALSAGPSGA